MIKKILRKIAHFQVLHPFISLFLILSLTIMIWGGISKVNTVASLELMMPKNIEEISAFNDLRDNHLGQDMIAIILKTDSNSQSENGIFDIRDERVYNYIKNLNNQLSKESNIIDIYSFDKIVDSYNFQHLDYNQFIKNEKIPELNSFINSDYTTTVILLRTDLATDDLRMNMLSEKVKIIVEDQGNPPGVLISYTGTPMIQQKLGVLINKDRSNSQLLSTFLVFLVTALVFRSFLSALVPIIVVSVSINWLYGTMGYTALPVSTLSGGVAAMVIGIGIDFSIHIMNKFKYEIKKGNSIKDSIELALTHTGIALFVTTATTVAAFLAFLFGVMPEMGRFGLLMTIGIIYSLIFAIFLLPTLLILEEMLIYYVKDKVKFGIDGELHLEVNDIKNKNKKGGLN